MTSAQTEKASSRLRRAGRARAASTARRAAAYTVLGLLCFLCLFFFYILLINATRTHFEILRCSVFIFQRSPPTASMPMTSNSKSWPLRSSCSS
mgnify:CR=1 FL=1